ncbi:hypothetical protein TNCV_4239221 [Trichonephila clavipes]|nr:hypothetical protein TNCV_4239221 [Trichonephila clavipes]
MWDALGRQVAGRNYPPTNKNTLIRALTEEWDKLPQKLLDNVVQTKPSSVLTKTPTSTFFVRCPLPPDSDAAVVALQPLFARARR